jgi:predicted dehydrogenase
MLKELVSKQNTSLYVKKEVNVNKLSPLRIGVVGAGHVAEVLHLPVFQYLKEARVIAICDIVQEKARRLAHRFSIPHVYEDLEKMLEREELDLIDVCTPPQHHHQAIIKTLMAGLPCLVEKPFTVTTKEADEIIVLVQERGLPIFPIFDHPYFPGIRKAKELVNRGAIGKVIGVNISYSEPYPSRYSKPDHWCHNLPGDYFGDAEPHLAMLLVELLGKVREVKALISKTSTKPNIIADELCIIARFENGALGSITHSSNSPSFFMRVDIVGTGGILSVDGIFNTIVHYGPEARLGNPWALGFTFYKGILSQALGLTKTAATVLVNRYLLRTEPNAHSYLIPKAIRALQGRDEYPVKLEDARESVRLLELAFTSLSKKCEGE